MSVKIKLSIFIPSFSIWLALSNQVASANSINSLFNEKDKSCQNDKNENRKNYLLCQHTFREKLRAKFKNYRYRNNRSKPKIESNNYLDDEKQLSSSVNNLNISLPYQESYKLAQSNSISSNNLIQKLKKRKLEENLIKRISPARQKPLKELDSNSNYSESVEQKNNKILKIKQDFREKNYK